MKKITAFDYTSEDLQKYILKKLKDRKLPLELLDLITDEDVKDFTLKNIGNKLFSIIEQRNKLLNTYFPSWEIIPVNDINQGIKNSGLEKDFKIDIFQKNNYELPQIPLTPKKVYVMYFNDILMEYVKEPSSLERKMKVYGKKPRVNGINYLFGLLTTVPEEVLLELINKKDIIALEPNSRNSIIIDKGEDCYLNIKRYKSRQIHTECISPILYEDQAYLAEDL